MRKALSNVAATFAIANAAAMLAIGWVKALTGGWWIIEDPVMFWGVALESVVIFGGIAFMLRFGDV